MKTLTAVFLCLMVVALSGCSDDTASGPDEPEETLLGSATVGSAGGELTSEDFVLSVPAGAFAASSSLSLYETSEEHGFGDNAISPLYRLDGLPETFSESLYVRVRYTGTLTEESFVAFGDLTGEATLQMVPASDSSGYLTCAVPPRVDDSSAAILELGKIADPAVKKDYFAAIANYEGSYQTPYFTITYPAYLVDYIDDLASYVDESYNALAQTGISFASADWSWPGTMTIKQLPDKSQGKLIACRVSCIQWPRWTLNESKISTANMPELRKAIARAMMKTAQAAYYPWELKTWQKGWWHEAVAQWFPEKTVGVAAYPVPDSFPGREMSPFDGMCAGATGTSGYTRHGYGMAPLVKHLVTTYGDNILGKIYNDKVAGDGLVDEIGNAAGDAVYNWLPEFFDRYLRGLYYNVPATKFLEHTTSTFSIESDADSLKSFYRGCPELGAQIYRINLDNDTISSSATMNLTLEGSGINPDYLTVLLYKYKDNVLTYLDAGHDIDLGNPRTLTDDGYDLIAVAVNSYGETPYTGTSALTLTVRITSSLALDYPRCRLRLTGITGLHTWRNTLTGETGSTESSFNAQFVGDGGFTGNTFYASWDKTESGYRSVGSMEVTVDPVAGMVTSFGATETTTASDYTSTHTLSSVAGMPLPMRLDTEVDLIFFEQGQDETCDHFTYSNHYELQQLPETWIHDLVATGCDDMYSTVAVEFYEEE